MINFNDNKEFRCGEGLNLLEIMRIKIQYAVMSLSNGRSELIEFATKLAKEKYSELFKNDKIEGFFKTKPINKDKAFIDLFLATRSTDPKLINRFH